MPHSEKITITQDGPYIVSGSAPLSLQTIGKEYLFGDNQTFMKQIGLAQQL